MNCSTAGFPALRHLPKLAQTHVHWVGDDIHPSHPVAPFSRCPQSCPASGWSSVSQLFASGGQSIGVSASAHSMNHQGWFPLGWTGLISLLSPQWTLSFGREGLCPHFWLTVVSHWVWDSWNKVLTGEMYPCSQVKKTTEATLQTIQDMVTIEDYDVSECFQHSRSTESVKSTVSETYLSKPSIAKRRANQQETEQFYFMVRPLLPQPPGAPVWGPPALLLELHQNHLGFFIKTRVPNSAILGYTLGDGADMQTKLKTAALKQDFKMISWTYTSPRELVKMQVLIPVVLAWGALRVHISNRLMPLVCIRPHFA